MVGRGSEMPWLRRLSRRSMGSPRTELPAVVPASSLGNSVVVQQCTGLFLVSSW